MNAEVQAPDIQHLNSNPEAMRALIQEQRESEKVEFAPEPGEGEESACKFPPLTPSETRVADRLKEPPPPPEGLLYMNGSPILIRGITGIVVAAGGTGKSFFLLQLAYAMAKGVPLGPLTPKGPCRVLVLAAEDMQDEVDRRLWAIGGGSFPEGLFVASIAGRVGSILELEGGNPTRTEHYEWLQATLQHHLPLDAVILDPKSRICSLDEQSNPYATAFISALESLIVSTGLNPTILFAHHTSKERSHKMSPHMARGASALVDGARWTAGMTPLDEKTIERYGIEDPGNYVKMDIIETNYSAKLSAPLYFRRGRDGVLEYVSLESGRIREMSKVLASILEEGRYTLTRRELVNTKQGKPVCEKMKEHFNGFTQSRDMDRALDAGLELGILEERKIGTGTNHRTEIVPANDRWENGKN